MWGSFLVKLAFLKNFKIHMPLIALALIYRSVRFGVMDLSIVVHCFTLD